MNSPPSVLKNFGQNENIISSNHSELSAPSKATGELRSAAKLSMKSQEKDSSPKNLSQRLREFSKLPKANKISNSTSDSTLTKTEFKTSSPASTKAKSPTSAHPTAASLPSPSVRYAVPFAGHGESIPKFTFLWR